MKKTILAKTAALPLEETADGYPSSTNQQIGVTEKKCHALNIKKTMYFDEVIATDSMRYISRLRRHSRCLTDAAC